MQQITPCLWFDGQAEEAVKLYTSLFPNSTITATARYGKEGAAASGQPEGSVMTVKFELDGQAFLGLNGGPIFKFTPAISLFVSCKDVQRLDALYNALSEGGSVLMPYQKYPFSEKYAWVQDKFGVSWQLNLAERNQMIATSLMFTGDNAGKAEEAMNFYMSHFPNSAPEMVARYEEGEDTPGFIKYAAFHLNDRDFTVMDSGAPHGFTFTHAISFIINCETQQEIDTYWEKLSKNGTIEHCGWLTDQYGVAWQVVPKVLGELMSDNDPAKSARVMQAMLKMVKLDIAGLQAAYKADQGVSAGKH